MTIEGMADLVRRTPFRPMRVSLTSGASYEVRGAEYILCPAEAREVLVFAEGNVHYLDPAHIDHVEELSPGSEWQDADGE